MWSRRQIKDGGDASIVQQALNQLRQNEQLVELESLLGFFASFVLGTQVVRQIMRWDMAVLRESPWYQEILQEGERRGREEGREEERLLMTLKFLARRVGEIPPEIEAQVRSLSWEKLDELGEALFDFSNIEDFSTWLSAQA